MKVCKFGGSSLGNADQIKKVCRIIKQDPQRRIIVVSAPGKRNKNDIKVTDLLIKCADSILAGYSGTKESNNVIKRFIEIQKGLGLDAEVMEEIRGSMQTTLNKSRAHKWVGMAKVELRNCCHPSQTGQKGHKQS